MHEHSMDVDDDDDDDDDDDSDDDDYDDYVLKEQDLVAAETNVDIMRVMCFKSMD
jgi:hypothetical protein